MCCLGTFVACQDQIWHAAEGLAGLKHPPGCYTLLRIHMALPGDPEYIQNGYGVLGMRGIGAPSQGKPHMGVSCGAALGFMAGVTGRALASLASKDQDAMTPGGAGHTMIAVLPWMEAQQGQGEEAEEEKQHFCRGAAAIHATLPQ